jgi:hypothetical protein
MLCPQCHLEYPDSKRYCPDCGTKLEPSPSAAARSVNVTDNSQSIKADSIGSVVLGGVTPAVEICPICGKKYLPHQTFRCQGCQRDHLCEKHQDPESFLCVYCEKKRVAAEAARRKTPGFISISGDRMSILVADGLPLELVRVPAGQFLMGSDKGQDKDAFDGEYPLHIVNLPEYWIGRYPVTTAQFAAFVQASGYQCQATTDKVRANHPAVKVSWYDARAFCDWLSGQVQANPSTEKVTVRLPSEADWEKAARGTDGCIYP